MDYSKETYELIERMFRYVARKDFSLNKKLSEKKILETYDLFNLPRPKNIVWVKDIFDKDFASSAGSAGSARSAGAGAAEAAWSAGSAGSARSAGAGAAEAAWSVWSTWSAWWPALDYDFDWFVREHEYCINRKDNPGEEPNEHDRNYLKYSELLLEALEAGLGYVVEREDTIYLCPTPVVRIDEQNRFHSEIESAIKWKGGKELYYIHGVTFEKEWWNKIVNDEMSPEEILAIDNVEHRRIAWEYMSKKKLEGLKDFKVLDEQTDGKGFPMRVIQFNHPDAGEIRYYNCFCPTTNREYYLGTEETSCEKAKSKSFGLDEIEFINEW